MKYIKLVFILAFLTFVQPLNLTRKNVMQVAMEIEAKLKQNQPLDRIQKIVDDFRKSVEEEQRIHDQMFERQNEVCQNEARYTKQEIRKNQDILNVAEGQLNSCKSQKNGALENLKQAEKLKEIANERYGTLIENEKQEESEYLERKHEYEEASGSIKKVHDLLISRSPMKEVLQLVKAMVHQAISIEATTQYAPVLQQLNVLKLQEKKNSGKLEKDYQKGIDMVLQLQDAIQQSFESYEQTYIDLKEVLQLQKNKSFSALQILSEQIAEFTRELEIYHKCIDQQTSIIQQAKQSILRDQQTANQAISYCSSYEEEYEETTNQRNNELEVIEELQKKIRIEERKKLGIDF